MFNLFTEYQNFPKGSRIYKITTTHNKKFYIGSALSLSKRMKDHRNLLKKGNCHCTYLQNVFNKHGESVFVVEILEVGEMIKFNSEEHKKLIQKEEYYISLFNSEYNTIKTPSSQKNNPATSKKIYQYDLDGNFIKDWNSGREVLRELGIQTRNALIAKNGKSRSSGGFQWSYNKVSNIGKYVSESGTKRSFSMYNRNRELVRDFKTINECVKYFKGDRKTYQKIAYAIKIGRVFENKFVFK